MFIARDGSWTANAPAEVREGSILYPGLMPIWVGFNNASRGRPSTMMGMPLPLLNGDIEKAARKVLKDCEDWSTIEEVEDLLSALDSEFMEIAKAEAEKMLSKAK